MDGVKRILHTIRKNYKNKQWLKFVLLKKTGLHYMTRWLEDAVNYHPTEKTVRDGWSFVLKTDGRYEGALVKVLDSIEAEFSGAENFEILIIGNVSHEFCVSDYRNCRHIPYHYLKIALERIAVKYVIGANLASFDKIVFAGNSVALCKGWKESMADFGNDWEVCTTKLLNYYGQRANDWVVWDYPGIGQGLLPYEAEHSDYQFLLGRYFITKRDFFRKYPYDKNWYAVEHPGSDWEWSMKIRKKTIIKINRNASAKVILDRDPPGSAPYDPVWMANTEKLKALYKSGKLL